MFYSYFNIQDFFIEKIFLTSLDLQLGQIEAREGAREGEIPYIELQIEDTSSVSES